MSHHQVVVVSEHATSFTTVCERCEAEAAGTWASATVSGRLEAESRGGLFLCRRGHGLKVERAQPPGAASAAA